MNDSYTSYSFHESGLEIAPELRGRPTKYAEVARAVFDAWTRGLPTANAVPLVGKLARVDEGRGGVVVCRLDFCAGTDQSTKLRSFILRFYSGPDAVKTLEQERSHIERLKTFINDCLAVETLDIPLKEPPVLVLSSAENRHDQLHHLHEVVRPALDLPVDAVEALSQSLKHFMGRVTNAYAKLTRVTQIPTAEYIDSEGVKVLPPEIVVDAPWGLEVVGEDTIVVNLEHTTPKISSAVEVDADALYEMAGASSPERALVKTTVFLDEIEGTTLQFRTAQRRIWIRLKEPFPLPGCCYLVDPSSAALFEPPFPPAQYTPPQNQPQSYLVTRLPRLVLPARPIETVIADRRAPFRRTSRRSGRRVPDPRFHRGDRRVGGSVHEVMAPGRSFSTLCPSAPLHTNCHSSAAANRSHRSLLRAVRGLTTVRLAERPKAVNRIADPPVTLHA